VKSTPPLDAKKLEVTTLTGDMWWEDSEPAKLCELKLFPDRLYLDVESDGFRYRGTLKRHGTTNQYSGTFPFADEAARVAEAGTVKASCTLKKKKSTYVLSGLWTQSDQGQFEWHAELEQQTN
jgi:hypothetical protein